MTNYDLRYWYKEFNRRFFSGKLPKSVSVGYRKLPRTLMGRAHFVGPSFRPTKISVSERMKIYDKISIIILLHEMAHISIGGKYKHGKTFWKEVDRLYKAGAYTRVRGGVL